jgi:hypothetical protein
MIRLTTREEAYQEAAFHKLAVRTTGLCTYGNYGLCNTGNEPFISHAYSAGVFGWGHTAYTSGLRGSPTGGGGWYYGHTGHQGGGDPVFDQAYGRVPPSYECLSGGSGIDDNAEVLE